MTDGPARVLIAGGGVAGLEAALALRELAGERVELELLAPNDRFQYKPMLVAEPFGSGPATSFDLAPIVDAANAVHRRDSVARVHAGDRIAITAGGERLGYDCLLLAIGGRAADAVPGALTFADRERRAEFAELLTALGRLGTRRIAFVVPSAVSWPIAAYELALLTAAECRARRIEGVELTVVTHESAPLDLLGPAASRLVAGKLDRGEIRVRTRAVVQGFADRKLALAGAEPLGFDRVVALPRLEVAPLEGVPQDDDGFLLTDGSMQVLGLDSVWAAGDATAFPVKHGGVAAQEAEIAARAIAARAGSDAVRPEFEPLVRAAMLTDRVPAVLEATLGEPDSGVARTGRLSWPGRAKIAAPRLGAHVARALESAPSSERDAAEGSDAADTERALRSLLLAAEAAAEAGDPESALGWLEAVEHLDLVIPIEYVARRDEWRRRLHPDLPPDAAADRLASRFASAAEALSDLSRRVGWLRAIEARTGGEMSDHMRRLEADIEHLRSLSRKTGVLGGAAAQREERR